MKNEDRDKRTILINEEDDETRGLLARNLRGYGYLAVVALDEDDAQGRAGAGGFPADLVLVKLVGKAAAEVLAVGRRVRERARDDGRTRYDGRTPLSAMPERYSKDVEGTEANAGGNDRVFYLGEAPGQLRNLLARLLPVGA